MYIFLKINNIVNTHTHTHMHFLCIYLKKIIHVCLIFGHIWDIRCSLRCWITLPFNGSNVQPSQSIVVDPASWVLENNTNIWTNDRDQFLTSYRTVQSIFHLMHSYHRISAKFLFWIHFTLACEWGTGRSFELNRTNIRRIIQPLHIVTYTLRLQAYDHGGPMTMAMVAPTGLVRFATRNEIVGMERQSLRLISSLSAAT